MVYRSLGPPFTPDYTRCGKAVTTGPDVTFTFQDWLQTPENGLRHEILEGDHVVTLSPNLDHQRISGRIYYQLFGQIQLHVKLSGPSESKPRAFSR